jgi:fructosamine-3-kinase
MKQKVIRADSKEQTMEYAKRIICEHYSCDIKSIKYVGGGSFGYVYKVEIPATPHKLIAKACRVSGMHLDEINAMKMLGNNSLIHIPDIYFKYDATDDIPMDFIVEEFIDGTDCFTDYSKLFLSKKKKQAFANNIADCLANWHSITNNKFGSINNPEYDNWLDYYKPFAQDILTTAVQMNKDGLLNNKTINTMKIAWDNFDYIFSEPVEQASLIHGDLNVMNIMSDKNLNVTAIIDPLECKWADKEFDLFQLKNMTGEFFNLYETYKSKYPVSSKCDLKCAFYAVYNEVYCFIASGGKIEIILKMVVRRLNKEMKKAGLI